MTPLALVGKGGNDMFFVRKFGARFDFGNEMAKPRGSRPAVNEVFLDVVWILIQDCLEAVFSSISTPHGARSNVRCGIRFLCVPETQT